MVPRTRLPDILRVIHAVSERHGLAIGNVFHAGDGNIHPIVLYDERVPGQVQHAIDAGREILTACVELGGSLTGEHGIGVEKMGEMPLLFSPDDLMAMTELRRVFDPDAALQSRQGDPHAGRVRRSHLAAKASPSVSAVASEERDTIGAVRDDRRAAKRRGDR